MHWDVVKVLCSSKWAVFFRAWLFMTAHFLCNYYSFMYGVLRFWFSFIFPDYVYKNHSDRISKFFNKKSSSSKRRFNSSFLRAFLCGKFLTLNTRFQSGHCPDEFLNNFYSVFRPRWMQMCSNADFRLLQRKSPASRQHLKTFLCMSEFLYCFVNFSVLIFWKK